MKQKYVPLEKQSRRKQKEYYASLRGSWGGVNPVTRKPPNPRAYNRKKSGQRHEGEPLPGLFFTAIILLQRCVKRRRIYESYL